MVYVHERVTRVTSDPNELLDGGTHLEADAPRIDTKMPVFGTAEDFILGILRPHFEPLGVGVYDQHSEGLDTPLILARSSRASANAGYFSDDVRFMRSYKIVISTITTGVEADRECSQLIEAVQHVLMDAWDKQTVVPGCGSIAKIRAWVDPVRVSDYQTATNIVQYPSLPKGHVRYEQNFNILVRPDFRGTTNPFLVQHLIEE